jgi:1-acylglycerone phosphate reductase
LESWKSNTYELLSNSLYKPIKEDVLKIIKGERTEAYAEDRNVWAENVVKDLLRNTDDPPAQIWRGSMAGTISRTSALDGILRDRWKGRNLQELGGLDKLGKMS